MPAHQKTDAGSRRVPELNGCRNMVNTGKCWMPENAECGKIVNAGKWWMPENGECRKMVYAGKWWMPENVECRKMLNAGKYWMPENIECRSKVNRNKLSGRRKDDIRDLLSRVRIDVLEKFRKTSETKTLKIFRWLPRKLSREDDIFGRTNKILMN